jgi:hypothetical protein
LCIIEPGTKPPDHVLRRASADMLSSHAAHLKCIGIAVEGEGFWAAMTRGVLIGMSVLMPERTRRETFSDVPGALRWIQQYLPTISVEGAARFIESARGRVDTTSTS